MSTNFPSRHLSLLRNHCITDLTSSPLPSSGNHPDRTPRSPESLCPLNHSATFHLRYPEPLPTLRIPPTPLCLTLRRTRSVATKLSLSVSTSHGRVSSPGVLLYVCGLISDIMSSLTTRLPQPTSLNLCPKVDHSLPSRPLSNSSVDAPPLSTFMILPLSKSLYA